MLTKPQNYAIYPSVVMQGVETEMTILATEKAFLFQENTEYELTVIGINNDETSYSTPTSHKKIIVTAKSGYIQFHCTFEGEQAFLIHLKKDAETKLGTLNVYAVNEDLYSLIPLKTDLHSHSFRSDGKRDPAAAAGHYREQGFDCYALTDHNRFYPGGEIDETYENVNIEFFRIPGEEVHAPGSVIHIVHIGGSSSVTELYCNDIDSFNNETSDYLKRVPDHIPAKYAERYAKAMWATDKIHAAGGLAIFPHPFWCPGKSEVYNVCEEFASILLKSGMFDAYELIGGMKQSGNNYSVALWSDLRAGGLKIAVVGSSDAHKFEKSDFSNLFTICFAKERTAKGVIEAVKSGNTVAVEASGDEENREFRCYGSLRLVFYAQFLLQYYYPNLQRICAGEGVAMRAYAIGEADKELIEIQAKQSRRFRNQFFGKEPPVLPSSEILAFEEKWRNIQRNGPKTKGSSIEAPPVTMQI